MPLSRRLSGMRIACLALSALVVTASALTDISASAAPAASVYASPLQNPNVYVAASGLYVSWDASRTSSLDELSRVDGTTGRIEAERYLAAQVDYVLTADGWLWVTVTTATNANTLLRLNPVTLAVTARLALGSQETGAPTLAVAGDGLWVAVIGKLLRLSLPGGEVTAKITLPGADSSMVAANAAGTVLLDGEADEGSGAVQRRDPRTGRLLASFPMLGVVEPWVGGVIDSGVWVAEATGMMGYVERLNLTTLKPEQLALPTPDPEGSKTSIEGTNGIRTTVADGLDWITQNAGGPQLNYCGDPRTGRKLAAIPLPQPDSDSVLAIGTGYIYYVSSSATAQYLRRLPIPARC
jgi:hypothetical protein